MPYKTMQDSGLYAGALMKWRECCVNECSKQLKVSVAWSAFLHAYPRLVCNIFFLSQFSSTWPNSQNVPFDLLLASVSANKYRPFTQVACCKGHWCLIWSKWALANSKFVQKLVCPSQDWFFLAVQVSVWECKSNAATQIGNNVSTNKSIKKEVNTGH